MYVIKSTEMESEAAKGEMIPASSQDRIYRQTPITEENAGVNIGIVNFNPGARLNFHTHDFAQVLIFTSGVGIVATEKEEMACTPGDIAVIPAGENHWHGATADMPCSHIAVFRGKLL